MKENHPQSGSRLSSSHGRLSHLPKDSVIKLWDVALDPLTNGRTMGGVAEWFCPGSGRFQSLNIRVKKKLCSHFQGLFLYSKCALKYLLSGD